MSRWAAPPGIFNLPDVESKHGFHILDERFGGQGTGQVGTIVVHADRGVEDPSVRPALEALFAKAAQIEDVTRVESPYGLNAAPGAAVSSCRASSTS